MQHEHRHLAAILFTDVVGYTSMMQKDEEEAVVCIKRHNAVMEKTVAVHHGEVLNFYGDGCLSIFSSVTEAVRCALEVQQQLQKNPVVPLRIGLHVGEIFFEEGKVMGDGVNIASRIQSLGQANTILFSKEIFDKIRNQPGFKPVSLGKFEFKNVDEPMEIFALANEGLLIPKRETIEGKLKTEKKIYSRKKLMIGAIILLFLVVISVFGYNKYLVSKESLAKEKSIAILPFQFIGTNEDNLGLGLAEDILVHLSKIKEFNKVISNKSSSQYTDTKKSVKEIGEELNVNFLVTGSIQQTGNRIRASVQLIDSKNGNTIWAEDYTREKTEIFDLQAELATKIVSALKTKLTQDEKRELSKRYTDNVEAYKFYRKGRYFWDHRTKVSFDSAEANYKHAIDLDPDYALAYAGLADCYTYNQKGLSQLEAVPIGRDYATKALLLDSTLSEALTTLGWIQGAFDYQWERSKATLEKAINLNPNYPIAHLYYGNLLQYTGENTQQGIQEIKKALQLDPLSVSLNWVLGRNYWFAKKYDSAFQQLKKTLTLDSNYYLARGNLFFVFFAKKNYSEALKEIAKLPPHPDPKFYDYQGPYLSYAYASLGDTSRAKKELEKTIKENPEQSPFLLARAYIALSDYNRALTMLESAYEIRDIRMYGLKVDPTLDPIRNLPRFKALLRKTGFDRES